jgi:hypothetical protein
METNKTKNRTHVGVRVAALCALTLAAGCNIPQSHLTKFNRFYEQGNLPDAEQYAQGLVKAKSNPSGDDLLWALQAGSVARSREEYSQSNEWFDRAEAMMKDYDTSFKGLDIVGTTVANETVLPYRGQAYDGIMVNTYKALNFMALGNDELARVEFNRALERQTRAKEHFNQEIQKLKDKMETDQNSKQVDVDKTLENPDLKTRITDQYPGLYDFQAYPDFVNPFSTYIAGVFFIMIGDPGKAVDLLKESAGMVPDNRTVAEDLDRADRWLDSGTAPEPSVWVVYEKGLGPIKDEFRIDLPLFLVTTKVYYAGIALPRLVPRPPIGAPLEVESAGTWVQTEVVSDMDRVIQTEFSKEFPAVLMRAIIATAGKAVAQNALLDQGDSGAKLVGLALAAYSAVSTVADVRIWTSLPKQFQVARVPMPTDGGLKVRVGGDTIEVPVKDGRYALVYIRMISAGSKPIYQVTTRGQPMTASPASQN